MLRRQGRNRRARPLAVVDVAEQPGYRAGWMRSVVYRFQDLDRLDALLDRAGADLLLDVPASEEIGEGEWVLAIFEVGAGRRATAAAARGTDVGAGPRLCFEARDFARIREFVRAARPSGTGPQTATKPPAPPRSSSVDASLVDSLGAGPYDSGKFAVKLGQGARVLLVDDDPEIREIVGMMLEAVGLVVETSPSAEDGLQRSMQHDFDLLVVDWNLPGMSGLDLCKVVRAAAKTATMPVLFLTANASSRDMVEAFASGADDYVVKPFRAPELGARIFGLLRRARLAGHGPSRAAP